MDKSRLRKLAGIETSVMEEYEAITKELDELMEAIHVGKHMQIDTDKVDRRDLLKRIAAIFKATQLLNSGKLPPDYVAKHAQRVYDNIQVVANAYLEIAKGRDVGREVTGEFIGKGESESKGMAPAAGPGPGTGQELAPQR